MKRDMIRRADAAAICDKHSYSNNPYVSMRMMDAAREIRALPAVEVGVRELEWVQLDGVPFYDIWEALTILGRYKVQRSTGSNQALLVRPNGTIDRFLTIEAAKAAAQADYAARIRSALTATPAQDVAGWAKFYIDCEFDGHDGPLLSLAMVREDGFSLHVKTDAKAKDRWVVENVMPIIDDHRASISALSPIDEVGALIKAFIGVDENPTIIADSPVDIGRFCRAISTGKDGGWSPTDYPGMTFVVRNVDCFPTALEGAVQHNAWWDAMALRAALARMKEASPRPINWRDDQEAVVEDDEPMIGRDYE